MRSSICASTTRSTLTACHGMTLWCRMSAATKRFAYLELEPLAVDADDEHAETNVSLIRSDHEANITGRCHDGGVIGCRGAAACCTWADPHPAIPPASKATNTITREQLVIGARPFSLGSYRRFRCLDGFLSGPAVRVPVCRKILLRS